MPNEIDPLPHYKRPALLESDLRLLKAILILSMALGLPLIFLSRAFSDTTPPSGWILGACLFVLCSTSLSLFWRKKTDVALLIFLWGFTLILLTQCVLINGIRTPVAAALPVVIMLSAWSLGVRHTIALSVFITLILSGMALLESHYWPIPLARSAAHYWATYVFCMAMGALLSTRLSATLRAHHAQQEKIGAELQARLRELQQAQNKFSTFFYLNPVPVSISLLADGTYFDVNPAWERTSGWTKQEVLGKTSAALGLWVDPHEREEWIASFRSQGRSSGHTIRFRLRNGAVRYCVANCEIVDYDGAPCIFAAFIDITERRDTEAALRDLNASLEARVAERTHSLETANQSLAQTVTTLRHTQNELVHAETMASLGSMVAGVSHELNTPIGNALTVASSLLEEGRVMAGQFEKEKITRQGLSLFISEQVRGAELACISLKRASELIASFKQVAVDQTSERRRSFDLAETLHSIINTLRPTLRASPVTLHCLAPQGVRMDSFPGPLGQIISNLVQNAVLHGLDGAPAGNIWVEATELGPQTVMIVVRDDGKGISDEHLGHIFDPFFTTKLGQGGSGLGLSIVYRLSTTLLGGSITVNSQPGQGCRFNLVVPKIAPDSPDPATPNP